MIMVKQFARAHVNTWALSSYIAADGQLVLGRFSDGRVEGRIGDGINLYPDLPSLSPVDQTGRFDRIAADAISHGAVADGSTDTTAALQAVIDEFPIIFLPAGVYVISDSLKIPSNRIIYGAQRDQTIIQAALSMPNNLNLIMSANTRTDGVQHTNYCENIHLRSFTVDGRGDERSIVIPNDTHGCNIKLSCTRDSSIRDIRSHDGVLHNIDVCASQYEPSWPAGSDGDVNYVPLGPSQRIVIADCISHDSVRDDPITCHDSSDILIERCRAYRTRPVTSGDIHGIEVDEGSYRVSITDCIVEDHNVGFQVKGHTNTTPSRDVHLTRCKAFRCRASFHIYHNNPASIPAGKVSWAKNVSLIDCESHDVEPKPDVVPDDLITCSVKVSGYRNVEIRNLICRGGTGEYPNNLVFDFGSDDVIVDGVWAIDVCQGATGVGRGFITTASAYGQGSNRITVRNVTIEGVALAIPVFRATNTATMVDLDGITGKGSTGPMIWLGDVKPTDRALRLVKGGFTNAITVGAGTFAGTHDRDLPYGSGITEWKKRLPSNYTSVFNASAVADVTGATIDIPVGGPEDVFDVEIKFDVRHNTAAPVSATEANTCKFIGLLSVNGTDRTESQAIFGVPGVQWARAIVSQAYPVTGLPAGNRTFKLRARHTIDLHPFTVSSGHTTITIKKVNASGWGATVES
jgi:hypothetical protein